jgi:transposase
LCRRRKRGAFAQAIGITRGGRNTKIHAISDDRCRPLAFHLAAGQVADIKGAVMLSSKLPKARYMLADKAYDANHWRSCLLDHKIQPVIPSSRNRKIPYEHDATRYKDRNTIERMFGRLKDYRRIATRYDKLAANFMAGLCIAAFDLNSQFSELGYSHG